MAFTTNYFVFDGIPCSEYGLMIYDISNNNQGVAAFQSTGSALTDWIPSRGKSFLYGIEYKTPLSFDLVFGLSTEWDKLDDDYLDRFEMDAIANWLTGHNEYKWLEISQADMATVRYKCVISNLKPVHISWLPWAFSATITCDSPYGYMYPKETIYQCSGETIITVENKSTLPRLYYPKVEIQLNGSDTISIANNTTGANAFVFTSLPAQHYLTLNIDNDNQVITSSNPDISNIYPYFNFSWLGLVTGYNHLSVTGDCIIKFICEFPVNFGG